MPYALGIIGYAGRMGQAIGRLALEDMHWSLSGGVVRKNVAPPIPGVLITTNPDELFPVCDVVVDVSSPQATAGNAAAAVRYGKAFVCGTTGLDEAARTALAEAAARVPVLYASNTSLSLAVVKKLAHEAARLLAPHDYDVTILGRHHRWKKDRPSGTAKTLGEAVVAGNGGVHAPQFADLHAGSVVGEHEVAFVGAHEVITIAHSVTDRDVFARGALTAALWLADHPTPGRLYGMDDVLGLQGV